MLFGKKKVSPEEQELDLNKKLGTHNASMASAMPQNIVDEQLFLDKEKKQVDLTKWQQDLEPELTKLIHDLRREYLGDDSEWHKETDSEGNEVAPICNDLLIRKMIALLRPSMSRNLMMSNYTEERILNRLRSLVLTFIFHLGSNYIKYDVDENDLSYILQLFKDIIDPTYYRAFKNGERKYHGTINKRNEIVTTMGENVKSKKLFNM